MKSNATYCLLGWLLCVFSPCLLQAQGSLRHADNLYEKGAYERAIRPYKRAVRKTDQPETMMRLADCYRRMGELSNALRWFKKSASHPKSLPEHKFRYALALKGAGQYEAAKTWFLHYAEASPNPAEGRLFAMSCDDAMLMMQDSSAFKVKRLEEINTTSAEITPVPYQGGLLFASNRKRGFFIRFRNSASKEPFFDLYLAKPKSGSGFGKASYFPGKLNSRFHDGPVSFTTAQDLAMISRSNMGKGVGSRDSSGINRLALYGYTRINNAWRQKEIFPFNNAAYDVTHPSLSPDGNQIFFASNMPGGFGGMDIYVSQRDSDSWTPPMNLGAEVNTKSNELYPLAVDDSTLYFSSDRASGLGGLDIFAAVLVRDTWAETRNLGYPLNSPGDDFGVSVDPNRPVGYFTSNRPGSLGDDLYRFQRNRALNLQVADSRDGSPLRNARVVLLDASGKEYNYKTDSAGNIRHYLGSMLNYQITASADRYQEHRAVYSFTDLSPQKDKFMRILLDRDRRLVLTGLVSSADELEPLSGASVRLIGPAELTQKAGVKGIYSWELEPGQEYTVIFSHPGYQSRIMHLSTINQETSREYIRDVRLEAGTFRMLTGHAIHKASRRRIPNARISVLAAGTDSVVAEAEARSDGRYWVVLAPDQDYTILGNRRGFFTGRNEMSQAPAGTVLPDTVNADVELVDIALDRIFKVIKYEFDRANINVIGKKELAEIAFFLQDNPEISLELASHTDSRGSKRYNLKLSEKRAKASKEYLITRNIAPGRIDSRGFGEERLTNQCRDGMPCTKEQHAENRRTEVKVVRIDPELLRERVSREWLEYEKKLFKAGKWR